jgi:uncharacterized membrane-anchored protein
MPMAFLDSLMAPLGKEHCTVYYVAGLVTLFWAVLALLNGVYQMLDKKSRITGLFLIFNSLTMFFMYYLYRIVYSICIKTL